MIRELVAVRSPPSRGRTLCKSSDLMLEWTAPERHRNVPEWAVKISIEGAAHGQDSRLTIDPTWCHPRYLL